MTCQKCGGEIPGDAAFCQRCGSPKAEKGNATEVTGTLAETAAKPLRTIKSCPFCGEEILEAALKCRFCGSDLTKLPGLPVSSYPGSNIVLNAPQPAGPMPAFGPSIVIQNVQAQQAPPSFIPGRYKNPGLAVLFSVIFPGGGQFYNGHAGKGILVLCTFWLIIPYIWSLFDAYSSAQRINRVGF